MAAMVATAIGVMIWKGASEMSKLSKRADWWYRNLITAALIFLMLWGFYDQSSYGPSFTGSERIEYLTIRKDKLRAALWECSMKNMVVQ